MHRRTFLKTCLGSLTAARVAWPADGWRTFEVTTRVTVQGASGVTRAWLPLAQPRDGYQRVLQEAWSGNAPILRALRGNSPGMLFAEWASGEAQPTVELRLVVATRDRTMSWSSPITSDVSAGALKSYLRPTRLLRLDGIVHETAERITRTERDDVAKARAIYEWIVENTERDPAVRGCGLGDIRHMLESGNLRGKCADLNALFVGLARSAGIPARDLYGIRVAPSRAFKSLGASGDVTGAQHCRAEFYSSRHGWIPVDPADVRKVILEEKSGLTLSSPEVQYARRQLFGSWEMNWIAFNEAHDVQLPQSDGRPLPYLMYPQAEIDGRRLDSLEPSQFRYQITARELTGQTE